MKKPPLPLEDEIKRVRTREEARLLQVARASGYFRHKITSKDLRVELEALCKANPRQSQLSRLEDQMRVCKQRMTAQQRKADARRKILLGSFLIAQMEHRPEEFDWVSAQLTKFLDTHKDPGVAAANKALMAEFIGGKDVGKSAGQPETAAE